VRAAACLALGELRVAATNVARSLEDSHASVRLAATKAVGLMREAHGERQEIALGRVPLTEQQKGLYEVDPEQKSSFVDWRAPEEVPEDMASGLDISLPNPNPNPNIEAADDSEIVVNEGTVSLLVRVQPDRKPTEIMFESGMTIPEAEVWL